MTAKHHGEWHVRKVGDKWIAAGMHKLLVEHKNIDRVHLD